MVYGCMVYTERAEMAAASCGTNHASAVTAPLSWTALYKLIHSCRIARERRESARERRIALYKSDQQHTTKTCIMGRLNEKKETNRSVCRNKLHVALRPQKRGSLLGTGKGEREDRMSGSSAQSDPQKTEEAVDHRQNNNYVKAVGISPLRSN